MDLIEARDCSHEDVQQIRTVSPDHVADEAAQLENEMDGKDW